MEACLKVSKEDFYRSKEVGEFLRQNLFKLGACFPWDETVFKATGEKLNPEYFLKDIAKIS